MHAVTQRPTSAIVLDLTGLRATKIQLGGRRVRRFSHRADQLVVVPDAGLLPGEEFTLDIRYEGNPTPRRGLWGEVGWEELTDGVLGGGPAERRTVLVPLQRPPVGQGQLPDLGDNGRELPGRVQRDPGRAHHPVQPRDLGLRAVRAHGHVPRHGPDRPLRASRRSTPSARQLRCPSTRLFRRRWPRRPARDWRGSPR